MSATVVLSPIVVGEDGIARIEGSRSKVKQIAVDHISGMSTRQIQEAYPHLTPGQIHAALSYYYARKEAFDAEIEQDRIEDEVAWQAQQEDPSYQKRLKKIRHYQKSHPETSQGQAS